MSANDFFSSGEKGEYKKPENDSSHQQGEGSGKADGDRGLISTVVGGAAGGYGGNMMGGKLTGVIGAIAGAVAANKIENKFESHNKPSSEGGVSGMIGNFLHKKEVSPGEGSHSNYDRPPHDNYGGSGGRNEYGGNAGRNEYGGNGGRNEYGGNGGRNEYGGNGSRNEYGGNGGRNEYGSGRRDEKRDDDYGRNDRY